MDMYLVQLFLPLYRNSGEAIPHTCFACTRDELLERFGGVTAYARAPASGLWKRPDGSKEKDDIVVVEVMTESLDEAWWESYRKQLEQRFEQQEVLLLAQQARRL